MRKYIIKIDSSKKVEHEIYCWNLLLTLLAGMILTFCLKLCYRAASQ